MNDALHGCMLACTGLCRNCQKLQGGFACVLQSAQHFLVKEPGVLVQKLTKQRVADSSTVCNYSPLGVCGSRVAPCRWPSPPAAGWSVEGRWAPGRGLPHARSEPQTVSSRRQQWQHASVYHSTMPTAAYLIKLMKSQNRFLQESMCCGAMWGTSAWHAVQSLESCCLKHGTYRQSITLPAADEELRCALLELAGSCSRPLRLSSSCPGCTPACGLSTTHHTLTLQSSRVDANNGHVSVLNGCAGVVWTQDNSKHTAQHSKPGQQSCWQHQGACCTVEHV
jgi:hypothetical protein